MADNKKTYKFLSAILYLTGLALMGWVLWQLHPYAFLTALGFLLVILSYSIDQRIREL